MSEQTEAVRVRSARGGDEAALAALKAGLAVDQAVAP